MATSRTGTTVYVCTQFIPCIYTKCASNHFQNSTPDLFNEKKRSKFVQVKLVHDVFLSTTVFQCPMAALKQSCYVRDYINMYITKALHFQHWTIFVKTYFWCFKKISHRATITKNRGQNSILPTNGLNVFSCS